MINWNDIDTVLLDMDGTLLDLHFDNHFWLSHLPQSLAKARRISLEAARKQLIDHMKDIQGTLPWYCLDYWSEWLELSIPELKREIAHLIALRPNTVLFLQHLQRCQLQVLLVTNAHRDSLALKMEVCPLFDYFHKMVSAHDYGYPKEAPEFWQQLDNQCSLNPAKTLLIDDNETVLHQAGQHGIKHLYTIMQPDSQKPTRANAQFPGITCFKQVLPKPSDWPDK